MNHGNVTNSSPPDYIGNLPSPKMVRVARRRNGKWSRKQIMRWGLPWPPPHDWQHQLRRRYFAALDRLTGK
jgi:hypothetical protein